MIAQKYRPASLVISSPCSDKQTGAGVFHLKDWMTIIGPKVGQWLTARYGLLTAVQERCMGRIDGAIHCLRPIGTLQPFGRRALACRQRRPFEVWWFRRKILRSHIDPDDTAAHRGAIGDALRFWFQQLGTFRLRRDVNAVAIDVVFPAMIDTAQSAFLVAAIIQVCAAMSAVGFEDSDPPLSIAKCDEIFAEKPKADRRTVRLGNLFFQKCGHPVMAQQRAHYCSRSDPVSRSLS